MHLITPPNISGREGRDVFRLCLKSMQKKKKLREDMYLMAEIIAAMCWNYLHQAKRGTLYGLPPYNTPNDSIFFSQGTKSDYIDLYENQMVGSSGKDSARVKVYDKLLAASSICPACGFGNVYTLDHYLPKTKYPQFSVFPANLVPCCRDCNIIKGTWQSRKQGEQVIHPYFDSRLINEPWLHAEIQMIPGPVIVYFADAPSHWPQAERERVEKHLEVFSLKKRFSIQAGNQLVYLRDFFKNDSAEDVKKELLKMAQSSLATKKNSWQTALYRGLMANDWYCAGGHQSF